MIGGGTKGRKEGRKKRANKDEYMKPTENMDMYRHDDFLVMAHAAP